MRTPILLMLVAGGGFFVGAPNIAVGQERSWVGESVLFTKPHNTIRFWERVGDKQVYFPFSGIMPINVRNDHAGSLRIHDGHREGWVNKADFVLARDAAAYFHQRVQDNPKDTFALYMRGLGWRQKGEPDKAINDFNECIRLDPTNNADFSNRGAAWSDKKEYDNAIRDYDEAIRLDPNDAVAYNNRGLAWSAKKQYDKAIADYNAAIRLDPHYDIVHFNRSVTLMLMRQPAAVTGFQGVIDLERWLSPYAVILGHLAARQAGDEAAATHFLKAAAGKLDGAWPHPAVHFLRGEIDEPTLLQLANDNDKRTEARCFLGLHHASKGRKKEAHAHFLWVKDHGTATVVEYTIAVAEIERLVPTPAEKKR